MIVDPADEWQYEILVRPKDKVVFSMKTDGTTYADFVGIREAAAEATTADYAIICRALVWALDRKS